MPCLQTEDFSEGERDFLDTLLVRDFHKRPTLAELISAVKGERDANPKLRWLSQRGTTEGDSNQGFEKEMQKRIKGYGKNKNMVAWSVSSAPRACLAPKRRNFFCCWLGSYSLVLLRVDGQAVQWW